MSFFLRGGYPHVLSGAVMSITLLYLQRIQSSIWVRKYCNGADTEIAKPGPHPLHDHPYLLNYYYFV